MLNPGTSKSYTEYAENVFAPYILGRLENVNRLDIVWDIYTPSSLKYSTRARRGHGKRRRVTANGPIPGNWTDFLKNDANKTELFQFLSSYMMGVTIPDGKQLQITHEQPVLSNTGRDVSHLEPCSHEESDTSVFIHVADAARTGHTRICIRTVDTDVLVLAISLMDKIPDLHALWLAFGTGKSYRYIPVHDIVQTLGTENAAELPFFHAFTGCDTVSSLYNHSKSTAWNVWQAYQSVTPTFTALSSASQQLSASQIQFIERYTVIMYDRTSSESSVNTCRKQLFTKKGRHIVNIPPYTRCTGSTFQARSIPSRPYLGQSLVKQPEIPSPEDWGWKMDSGSVTWTPNWTLLPVAAKACSELIQCHCKPGCRRSRGCSCAKVQLKCTALCHCSGECTQDK